MFELWARKRPVDGINKQFELIITFDDYNYRFTALNFVDSTIYKEALIVNEEQHCIMYVEFEEGLKRTRNKYENIRNNVLRWNKSSCNNRKF